MANAELSTNQTSAEQTETRGIDWDDPVASNANDSLNNTASKVMQGLEKVREHKEINRRRWLWELVQNAKDVPNRFGQVSIKIVHEPARLTFAHNGDPFRVRHVTALINQVSSKPSDSIDAQITGKYGTGFISTHLLSTTITVEGIVAREGRPAKHMTLLLDRQGTRSEDLTPKIKQARAFVENIDSDPLFIDRPDYDADRVEDHFDTVFTYPLDSEDARQTASIGLADLVNTLPHTLGNLPKVKRLFVEDKVTEQLLDYRCEVMELNGPVRKLQMRAGNGILVHFISYTKDGIALTVEVDGFERPRLKANFGTQPSLYRDFPLIGSEKFHFPFMLNSASFYPNEERKGLLLNDGSNPRVTTNRQVIERAMDLAVEFGQWLAAEGARNRFVVAYSRLPEADFSAESKEWYLEKQRNWRARLMELPLVETATGTTIALKDAVVPKQGLSADHKNMFWELAAPFHGYGRVPRKDLLLDWHKALGPLEEAGSWEQNARPIQNLERLFEQVQEKGSLENLFLEPAPGGSSISPIGWLNQLYRFAIQMNESGLLGKYAVVPDQYGNFHKLDQAIAVEDPKALIPGPILDVMQRLGHDWRSSLIHREIDLNELNHRILGLPTASMNVGKDIGGQADRNAASQFLAREDALDILLDLLAIVPPGIPNSFRIDLYKNATRFYQREIAFRETQGCAGFDFTPACQLLLELLHQRLAELGSIDALALFMNGSSDDATLLLDRHLRSINESEAYRTYLDWGNIVPNRYGQFKAYVDLYSFGAEQEPLDEELLSIVMELDPENDWRQTLVGDGIGIRMGKERSMLQLGKAIEEQVILFWNQAANDPDLLQRNQAVLVHLIKWCNAHDDEAKRLLPRFLGIKDKLSFDLVIKPNLSGRVFELLGDKRFGGVLDLIDRQKLDVEKVHALLSAVGTLDSLDKIIAKAEEMAEGKRDFEYKLALGAGMESALKEALDAEGFTTTLQGIGSYDIEVTNPVNGKRFFIELKSVAAGSTQPLKLAPSQVKAWVNDTPDRALCLIERAAHNTSPDLEYVKSELLTRTALASDLRAGNTALEHFDAAMGDLDIQLLGDVRVKLSQGAYRKGAGGFADLVQVIREALA